MKDLVVSCCRVAQKNPALVVDEQSKEYWKWRDTILHNEDVLLEALCFDLAHEPPYKIFFDSLNFLGEQNNKKLRDTGWTYINDSNPTMLCVLFPSRIIAASALYCSARFHGMTLPDRARRPWWEALGVSLREIREACNHMAEVYEQSLSKQPENMYSSTPEDGDPEFAKTRERRRPQDMSPTPSGKVRRGGGFSSGTASPDSAVPSQPEEGRRTGKRPREDDDDGAVNDGAIGQGTNVHADVDQGAVVDEVVSQGTNADGAADKGAATDEAVDKGLVEDGVVDKGAATDGAVDEGAVEDGEIDEGAVEDGAVDKATAVNGDVDKATAADGVVDIGAVLDGAVNQGAVDHADANQEANADGAVDQPGDVDGAVHHRERDDSITGLGVTADESGDHGTIADGSVKHPADGEGVVDESSGPARKRRKVEEQAAEDETSPATPGPSDTMPEQGINQTATTASGSQEGTLAPTATS